MKIEDFGKQADKNADKGFDDIVSKYQKQQQAEKDQASSQAQGEGADELAMLGARKEMKKAEIERQPRAGLSAIRSAGEIRNEIGAMLTRGEKGSPKLQELRDELTKAEKIRELEQKIKELRDEIGKVLTTQGTGSEELAELRKNVGKLEQEKKGNVKQKEAREDLSDKPSEPNQNPRVEQRAENEMEAPKQENLVNQRSGESLEREDDLETNKKEMEESFKLLLDKQEAFLGAKKDNSKLNKALAFFGRGKNIENAEKFDQAKQELESQRADFRKKFAVFGQTLIGGKREELKQSGIGSAEIRTELLKYMQTEKIIDFDEKDNEGNEIKRSLSEEYNDRLFKIDQVRLESLPSTAKAICRKVWDTYRKLPPKARLALSLSFILGIGAATGGLAAAGASLVGGSALSGSALATIGATGITAKKIATWKLGAYSGSLGAGAADNYLRRSQQLKNEQRGETEKDFDEKAQQALVEKIKTLTEKEDGNLEEGLFEGVEQRKKVLDDKIAHQKKQARNRMIAAGVAGVAAGGGAAMFAGGFLAGPLAGGNIGDFEDLKSGKAGTSGVLGGKSFPLELPENADQLAASRFSELKVFDAFRNFVEEKNGGEFKLDKNNLVSHWNEFKDSASEELKNERYFKHYDARISIEQQDQNYKFPNEEERNKYFRFIERDFSDCKLKLDAAELAKKMGVEFDPLAERPEFESSGGVVTSIGGKEVPSDLLSEEQKKIIWGERKSETAVLSEQVTDNQKASHETADFQEKTDSLVSLEISRLRTFDSFRNFVEDKYGKFNPNISNINDYWKEYAETVSEQNKTGKAFQHFEEMFREFEETPAGRLRANRADYIARYFSSLERDYEIKIEGVGELAKKMGIEFDPFASTNKIRFEGGAPVEINGHKVPLEFLSPEDKANVLSAREMSGNKQVHSVDFSENEESSNNLAKDDEMKEADSVNGKNEKIEDARRVEVEPIDNEERPTTGAAAVAEQAENSAEKAFALKSGDSVWKVLKQEGMTDREIMNKVAAFSRETGERLMNEHGMTKDQAMARIDHGFRHMPVGKEFSLDAKGNLKIDNFLEELGDKNSQGIGSGTADNSPQEAGQKDVAGNSNENNPRAFRDRAFEKATIEKGLEAQEVEKINQKPAGRILEMMEKNRAKLGTDSKILLAGMGDEFSRNQKTDGMDFGQFANSFFEGNSLNKEGAQALAEIYALANEQSGGAIAETLEPLEDAKGEEDLPRAEMKAQWVEKVERILSENAGVDQQVVEKINQMNYFEVISKISQEVQNSIEDGNVHNSELLEQELELLRDMMRTMGRKPEYSFGEYVSEYNSEHPLSETELEALARCYKKLQISNGKLESDIASDSGNFA